MTLLSRTPGIKANPPPRVEGTVTLPDGRHLGFAEYGAPQGPLVLWFHGTPGARRQLPPIARDTALALGLRIVCPERPGVGDSTEHVYDRVRDWAVDAGTVAERLGYDRFMVVGLSGGGPYALACAHEFPDQVVAVGLLGSVTPVAGDDIASSGPVSLARPFNRVIGAARRPLGLGLWALLQVLPPIAHGVVVGFTHLMPEGDRRVLLDPDYEAMFVDDLLLGAKRQFQAMVNDVILLGRPWGFTLSNVKVPVRWWHGDADPFVPLEQAQRAVALLPDAELRVRPGESHLGGFAVADEVLGVLSNIWHEATPPGAP